MPIRKITFRDFRGGAFVNGPVENTPAGALRRAFSIASPRTGSLRSRSGGKQFFHFAATSMAKFVGRRILAGPLNGFNPNLFWGTTPGVVNPIGVVGGNRISFMEIPAQFLATNPNQTAGLTTNESDFLFIADEVEPQKLDASMNLSFWGIAAPSALVTQAITATPMDAAKKDIDLMTPATFAQWTGAGAAGTDPFTFSQSLGRTVDGDGSFKLHIPENTEGIATRSFAPGSYTPLDLTTFDDASTSTDEDYIEFYVQVSRPSHVKSVEMKFFVQPSGTFDATLFGNPNDASSTSPYQDYYAISLSVELVKKKKRKELISLGDFLPDNKAEVRKFLKDHPQGVAPDLDMQQFLHDLTIAVSRNTWTKVTIPKGLFDRAGHAGEVGFTWANVVGMQIGGEATSDGATAVWFEDVRLKGGVGTRGDYLWTITYRNDNTGSRSNPPTTTDANGNTVPITIAVKDSVASTPRTGSLMLDRQRAAIANLPAALSGADFDDGRNDPQVTHIELWRTIGNGNPGKPNAPFVAPSSLNFFLDQRIPVGTLTATDDRGDYPGMHSLSSAVFLDPNQDLTFDNAPPSHGIFAPVYHAPSGRVFCLDTAQPNRVIYSAPGRPESLGSVGFVEPTTPDDHLNGLVVWGDSVWAFSPLKLIQINGQDEPFLATTVLGAPGLAFDRCVVATPGGIVYLSPFGVRLFDGSFSRAIASDALAPIFRGSDTDGLFHVTANGTPPGPILDYGRGEVVLSDITHQTLIYEVDLDCWRVIPFGIGASLHEPDTTIWLATFQSPGQTDPWVNALEGSVVDGTELGGIVGETTVDGAGVSLGSNFDVQTPAILVGGESLVNVRMIYIEADTQGQAVTVNLDVDGTGYLLAPLLTTGKTRVEYNINLPGSILQLQFFCAAANITKRMEISSIEIEVYEPAAGG